MPLTFWDDIGEFIGVHRQLTIPELDGNIHSLHLRLKALEDATGKQIDFVEYTGTAIIVHFTDNTESEPFPLPVATMRYIGLWTNSSPLAYLDVFTVAADAAVDPESTGLYMTLLPHVTPDPPALFDPEALSEDPETLGELLYMPLMPLSQFAPLIVDTEPDTEHTLVLTDANHYIRCTNAFGCDITVPTDDAVDFDVGTEITFRQAASGSLAVLPQSEDVTINPPHPDQTTISPWMGATFTLKKVAEDEWDYIGPGTPVS